MISNNLKQLSELLNSITASKIGYQPGSNYVLPVSNKELKEVLQNLPVDFQLFYKLCDGIMMPDVYNGYFIDTLERLSTTDVRGEPSQILDSSVDILVFGSDGGGGRFAIDHKSGEVYYLPSGGSIRYGVFSFLSSKDAPILIAKNFNYFIERLLNDVRAFLQEDKQWAYLTDNFKEK
ncbi:MAG: SMI1/KNR4 family protein [Daejeonella sp.]